MFEFNFWTQIIFLIKKYLTGTSLLTTVFHVWLTLPVCTYQSWVWYFKNLLLRFVEFLIIFEDVSPEKSVWTLFFFKRVQSLVESDLRWVRWSSWLRLEHAHWVSVSTLRESPAALAADSAVAEPCVCLPDSSRCVWVCLFACCWCWCCWWWAASPRLLADCCRGKRVCERVCAGGDRGSRVNGEVGGVEQPGESGRCWCW